MFLSHCFHVYRPSLSHPSRSGDPGFLWKHSMGLASRVGEMGKWGNEDFLALFRLGFLWVFVGAQGDVPKISSNPFSLCLFALHPISAAPGAHRKQGPGSCQKLLVLACLTIPFQKRSLWEHVGCRVSRSTGLRAGLSHSQTPASAAGWLFE